MKARRAGRLFEFAWVCVAVVAALIVLCAAAPASAITVGAGNDRATITRDAYGVPHIRSNTVRGMWFGAG